MQHLFRNIILVALVLVFFSWGLWPPNEKIRLGKDLRGGVTLVYQLQVDPGQNADEVRQRTIEVLKERIDPSGLLEISIIAQGRDRIEITMPLPSDEIKALRQAVDDEINALRGIALTEAQLNRVLSKLPEARRAEIQRVAGGNPDRAALIDAAARAYDRARESRAEYDAAADAAAAGDPDADPQTLDDLLDAAADAQIAMEEVIDGVVASTPRAEEVRAALEKSSKGRQIFNSKTGLMVTEPSPRTRAIGTLQDRYPDAAALIDRIVHSHDAYLARRTTLDDPADLIRLIKNAGVLSYRISVDAQGDEAHPQVIELRTQLRENGPRRAGASDARWFKINKIKSWYDKFEQYEALRSDPAAFFAGRSDRGYVVEEYEGDYWMLCWDRPGWRLTQNDDNLGEWGVKSAGAGQDRIGKPAINFLMDTRGAVLLGELTGNHVGDNMAVLLDDEVYTAPGLISRISRSGQISGDFPQEELDYIIRVLSAGSLQARLSPEPISQSTIGPSLGADNLNAGMIAGVAGLLAVSGFMMFYYFRCGMIAVVALACNSVLILGALAHNKAALTLPGIAGIVLTFGMAVDANVLIYERIREELRRGADIRTAVRLGYQKALSSIVDGNVTNLIICIVLVLPGVSTQEVKGFAITLGVGVLATLFTALIVTRILFAVMIDHGGWKKIRMLPMVVPQLERLLHPRVNWLKLRWVFICISTVYVGIGLTMVIGRGSKMLDTEFLGGTKIVLQFKLDDPGEMLTREAVAARVVAIGERALEDDDPDNDALGGLRGASVLPQNPQPDGISSDTFRITTTVQQDQLIIEALQREFAEELDSTPSIRYAGQNNFERSVYPIRAHDLRTNLDDRSTVGLATADVTDYIGGALVLLENLDPPISLDDLRTKIERMRESARPETLARHRELIVLEGDEDQVISAALVVLDDDFDYIANPDSWEQGLAREEWELARDALGRVTTLAEVQKFSASIASTFKGRAVAAVLLSFLFITIYIWVRFGTMRYSIAAIVCLMHDVLTCIGLIALAEIVYDMPAIQGVVRSMGIQPFKIDLTMVAAILTIIGYSLNDTIVIMDRIRENRGRLPYASTEVINDSINQTISRTVITSGTTFIAVLILYIFGGDGVRAFSFALLVGIVVGTYSSVAVAAPLVWSRKRSGEDPRATSSTALSAETESGSA